MRALVACASCCVLAASARAEPCAQPGEPALAILIQAALRSSALEPARMRSVLRRTRVAGLLPEVSVRVGRGAYDAIRNADTLEPSVVSSDTLRFDVTVKFSLDRLIFDTHELRALEATGRIAEHRARLVDQVTSLWAERRAHGRDGPGDGDRCAQLGAVLDALTGGALGGSASISLPVSPGRR